MVNWLERVLLWVIVAVFDALEWVIGQFFPENQLVYIRSPYNGFGGFFDSAFAYNMEVFPWLLSILFIIGAMAIPFSSRQDLDYLTLIWGFVKVVIIVAVGRPAIHVAVQICNALASHIFVFGFNPLLVYTYLWNPSGWDHLTGGALIIVGLILAFLALFGLLAIIAMFAITQFMVYATYVLLPILAPFVVFDFGPLKSFAKPAKLQIGATFFLVFVFVIFMGYLQVGVAAMGGFAANDVSWDSMTEADAQDMRASINGWDERAKVTASFVTLMSVLTPFFLAKRFMGAAISTGRDRGLRGRRGKSKSSGSDSGSSTGSVSGSSTGPGSGSTGGASGSATSSAAKTGSSTASKAGSSAASSGSGSTAGGSAGSLGGPVGAATGAALGEVVSTTAEQIPDQLYSGGGNVREAKEKYAEMGSTAGSVAAEGVEAAGRGVRHMMANPHGNPMLYGATGLRHGYNELKERSNPSSPSFGAPDDAEGLPAGPALPEGDTGASGSESDVTGGHLEGKYPETTDLEGTYIDNPTEKWGHGHENIGYIDNDDLHTPMPIRTTQEDGLGEIEDGEKVRLTNMKNTQTTQGTAHSHDPSESHLVNDEQGEDYITFVPSEGTDLERVD